MQKQTNAGFVKKVCIHEVFAKRKIHFQRPQRSNKERPPVQLV